MSVLTIRNVSDEVRRALRVRAASHDRSMEAEVRAILDAAVRPTGRLKLGSYLAQVGQELQLTDDEFAIFEQARDRTPTQPLSFG